jgi:hypothetical protein
LLSDFALQPNVPDLWLWRHDPGDGYTVRGAYNLLSQIAFPDESVTTTLLWHKQVPVKLSVLAWRLLRNRLPTRDNLVRRHIIALDSQFCVTGCSGIETTQHLFLSCPVFAPLWTRFRLGLIFPRLILCCFQTILSSLLILLESLEHAALSCSYFGYVAFGWCGWNGIVEFSRPRNRQCPRC